MGQSVMKTKALLLLAFSAIALSACVQVTNTPVVDTAAKVAISSVRDAATQFPQGSNFVIKTHYVDHASTPPAEQRHFTLDLATQYRITSVVTDTSKLLIMRKLSF